MKMNTKSSITLPAAEVRVVERLQKKLRARTKVEVIRRALRLLQETSDRAELRRAFREASVACRKVTLKEIEELDALTSEGLNE
jgi:hypothetical protein